MLTDRKTVDIGLISTENMSAEQTAKPISRTRNAQGGRMSLAVLHSVMKKDLKNLTKTLIL